MEVMRRIFTGTLLLGPRHKSWTSQSACVLLKDHAIDRVLADPASVWPLSSFCETPRYIRLPGVPRIYCSSYGDAEIRTFAERLGVGSWCAFDNTASGAAIENALTMRDYMADR